MNLKDLMAISGYPGLFRFVSQGRNAIIVESLEDKKRMSAYPTSKISTLEEIAVFTDTEELPLTEVFRRMYKHSDGRKVISPRSTNEEIKAFFQEVLPEYDRERVYLSDMKKIIHWYNLLLEYDMLHPEEDEKSGSGDDGTNEDEEKAQTTGGKNPAGGNKPEGYTRKKSEGRTGHTAKSSQHQPGKSIRQQPRKS